MPAAATAHKQRKPDPADVFASGPAAFGESLDSAAPYGGKGRAASPLAPKYLSSKPKRHDEPRLAGSRKSRSAKTQRQQKIASIAERLSKWFCHPLRRIMQNTSHTIFFVRQSKVIRFHVNVFLRASDKGEGEMLLLHSVVAERDFCVSECASDDADRSTRKHLSPSQPVAVMEKTGAPEFRNCSEAQASPGVLTTN